MYLSLCQKDDLKAKKTLPPDGEVLVLILLDLESLMRKDIFLVQDADISNLSFFTWFQNTPVLSMNLITFSSGSSTLRSTPAVLAILSTRLFITVFSCHFQIAHFPIATPAANVRNAYNHSFHNGGSILVVTSLI